jgi:hypothetical protein
MAARRRGTFLHPIAVRLFSNCCNIRLTPFRPSGILDCPVPLSFDNRFDNLCHLGDGAELFPWLMRQTEGRALHAVAPVAGYQLPQTVAKYVHWKDHACFAEIRKLNLMTAQASAAREAISGLPHADPFVLKSERILKDCLQAQLSCLRALTTKTDPQRLIIIALGGTEATFAALRSAKPADVDLQGTALDTIGQLYGYHNRYMLPTLGGGLLQQLLEYLHSHKGYQLLLKCIEVLTGLISTGSNGEHLAAQNSICSVAVADLVVHMLRFYCNDKEIIGRACLFVGKLTRRNQANQSRFAEKQVIPLMCSILTAHLQDAEIQRVALTALFNVCTGHEPNLVLMGQFGLTFIISALEAHSTKHLVANAAFQILIILSRNRINKPLVIDLVSLSLIVSVLRQNRGLWLVQLSGLILLQSLVLENKSQLAKFYENDGIDAVQHALTFVPLGTAGADLIAAGSFMLQSLRDYEAELPFSV